MAGKATRRGHWSEELPKGEGRWIWSHNVAFDLESKQKVRVGGDDYETEPMIRRVSKK